MHGLLKKAYKLVEFMEFIVKKIFFGKVYESNKKLYIKMNTRSSFSYNPKYAKPCYTDRYKQAGRLGAYFWQDLWAAQHLSKDCPLCHYDIGSRIDGFVGHISCFVKKVVLIDVRPLDKEIPNVTYWCMDATRLENMEDESISSISSLCALEHFGLGRYGDTINPEGCFEAFQSIQRVLKKGGKAYIAVPIGKEHVEFDAHRIFYASTIVESFSEMELTEFAAVHDLEDYIEYNIDIHKYDEEMNNGGLRFGLFAFEKR
ncbi:MAG TPA: hypothetical protein DCR27_00100 [Lachnospiraceae bacterium]|nr:hypothetical protein [Lachnospiraceae bacterium]